MHKFCKIGHKGIRKQEKETYQNEVARPLQGVLMVSLLKLPLRLVVGKKLLSQEAVLISPK